MPAIDPSFSVTGAEWQIAPVEPGAPAAPAAGGPASGEGSFAGALGRALDSLSASQQEATTQVQGLVAGQSADPTSVVMALERARLSMQLAGQIRTKAVEAVQDVFHTQV